MKTKRDKVRITLNQAEYMALEKAKDILEDYIEDCDKDDLVTLNEQLYQHTGVLGAVVGACDILQYICDESIVEEDEKN